MSRSGRSVLFVTDQVDTGGKRSHVDSLRAGLDEIGWQAPLVDLDHLSLPERAVLALPFRVAERLRPGLGHRWLLPTLGRMLAPRIRREIERHPEIALVHVQEPFTYAAARSVAGGRPIALTVHGPASREIASAYGLEPDHPTVLWLRGIENRAYREADAVVSVDLPHADYVRSFGRKERLRVIPNFVDTRRFHPGVTAARLPSAVQHAVADRAVILCPRRLVPKNGVEIALRAMAADARLSDCAALVVAGDGPKKAELESLCRELGLEPTVHWLGDVPSGRMAELCRRADVVVVPSVPSLGVVEATSIAALEAQACARPVVASAIGGLPEIIEHERTGVLVPASDPEALAKALLSLVSDPERASRIGMAAAEQVRLHRSHVAGARSYAEFYEEIL
jgi:glycosyltransferase involved in cell wall biosynthesis